MIFAHKLGVDQRPIIPARIVVYLLLKQACCLAAVDILISTTPLTQSALFTVGLSVIL